MSTSTPGELTDADWASVPRQFRLAMMDLRRERDNALAECDSATKRLARLQQDYLTVRAELHHSHADTGGAHGDDKRVVTMQAEIATLEAKLREACEEKENAVKHMNSNAKAALDGERERMKVDAENREHEMATRLAQAEASAREATQKLEHERLAAEECKRRLVAERDKAWAERDKAIPEREAAPQGLAARETNASSSLLPPPPDDFMATRSSLPPDPEPGLIDDDIDPNLLAPMQEPSSTTPTSQPSAPPPQADVIDLSMDSDDETMALISPLRAKTTTPSSAVVIKSEPRASLTPIVSSNASPGPGPSTTGNRAKNVKRSAADIEDAEPPNSAKRAKKPPGSTVASFDFGSTRKLLNAVPLSLNERVANIAAIKLTQIPSTKLPSATNPTVGWVKRELLEKRYSAWPMKMNNKLERIPLAEDMDVMDRYPALFARLDMNPGLPTYPGRPGTLICSRPDVELGVPLYLIVASLKSTWFFVGQVVLRQHEQPVTPKEWADMPTLTRNEWTKLLTKNSRFEAYQRLSLRISLAAKKKRPVDAEDVDRAFEKYIDANKPKSMLPTKDQVLDAFDRGWATLNVLVAEPVSVNEALYEEIWDRHLAGDYSRNDSESKKTNTVTEPKRRKKPPASTRSQSVASTSASTITTASVRRSTRKGRPTRLLVDTSASGSDDFEDDEESGGDRSDSDFEDVDD